MMAARPFNHIPVVDSESKVVGLATTKPLMKQTIEKLSDEVGVTRSIHHRRRDWWLTGSSAIKFC